MVLFALSFPLVIGLRQVQRDEALRSKLAREIDVQRQQLALDDPQRVLIRKHQRDQYESTGRLRAIALEQFKIVQQKYGEIEPQGPDVVSIRTIPQLSVDQKRPPVVFRILVPAEREVWLKYSLVSSDGGSQASKSLDQRDHTKIETKTGFQHTGPFQHRLQPGERILQVHTDEATGNTLPILVRLDDQILLDTSFTGDGVPSTGAFHISGQTQIDFGTDRPLPWLLNVKIRVEQSDNSRAPAPAVGCLWLSPAPSDFEAFPMQANQE